MFRKNKSEETAINLLIEKFKQIANESFEEASRMVKTEAEEHNARGILKSGIFFKAIGRIINNQIKSFLSRSYDEIIKMSEELNITFGDEEYEKIESALKEQYQSLKKSLDRIKSDWAKRLDMGIPGIPPGKDNNLILIEKEMEKIKLKNKIKKDPIEIKYIKKNYRLSVIAILIALISLIVSIVVAIYK